MSKPSVPKQPDPAATAQAQAEANRITQFTPQGNLLFGTTSPEGGFAQDTGGAASFAEETPFQRAARELGESTGITLGEAVAPQAGALPAADFSGLPERRFEIDWSKVGAIPDPNEYLQQAGELEQATYQRGLNLLTPEFERQERSMLQRLADQGLPTGGEAYTRELDRYGRERGGALENLALSSVAAGRQEQGRLFSDLLAGRGAQLSDELQNIALSNEARGAGFGERQAQRSGSLQELAALLGGVYNPTPGTAFFPPGQVDVVSPIMAAYQGRLNAYNQGQQQQAGLLSGLFGLGSAGLLAG